MTYPIRHAADAQQLTASIEGRTSLLQYRLTGQRMSIVHTEVPPEQSGQGIAAELMRAALELARQNGWRVRPACSYAAAFMQRHPEYADLLG